MVQHLIEEPECDYFTSGAWGSSSAKRGLVSIRAAKDMFDNKDMASSPSFALGTAWDRMLTGVGEWAERPEDLNARTKEGQAWLKEQAANDVQVVDAKQALTIRTMRERMPSALADIIKGARCQLVSRACSLGGTPVQARYDAVTPTAIVDIKTTGKHIEDFPRQCVNYGYDFQAAWYRFVWKLASGEEAPPFHFLVSETISPYRTVLFQPDDEFYRIGIDKVVTALMRIDRARTSDCWNDDGLSVRTLILPKWAQMKQDEDEGF